MRSLETIESELAAAKEQLARAEGTPTEVYSRIVGYYRSVRNWNRGKREEYAERRLYEVAGGLPKSKAAPAAPGLPEPKAATIDSAPSAAPEAETRRDGGQAARLILFVRAACPGCPPAKDAASRLSVDVELVDADTESGLERAESLQVFSTPTAILLDSNGVELRRARDARGIAALSEGPELARAASL